MRRTKAWWRRLTKNERRELVYLERADKLGGGGSAYLPEGYGECGRCSTPTTGSLCGPCLRSLIDLIDKANAGKGK